MLTGTIILIIVATLGIVFTKWCLSQIEPNTQTTSVEKTCSTSVAEEKACCQSFPTFDSHKLHTNTSKSISHPNPSNLKNNNKSRKSSKKHRFNKNQNNQSSYDVNQYIEPFDIIDNTAMAFSSQQIIQEVIEETPQNRVINENVITYEEPTPSYSSPHSYGGSGYGGGGGNSGSWDSEESSRSSYSSSHSSSSYDSGSSSSDSGGSSD